MTVKQFRKILEKQMSSYFVVYTNENDNSFKHLQDDEVSFAGENENEIFAVKIVKVKP